MPRFYCPVALSTGAVLTLPPGAARHVQVLRLQPGDGITLFNGLPLSEANPVAAEFEATVLRMGRSDVEVTIGAAHEVSREAQRPVHLAVGMPANDRMDWLVEKATELGVASIQPLQTERSVLRLSGERALKKQLHWQGIAVAACEQCGRNAVPLVHPIADFNRWLDDGPASVPGSVLGDDLGSCRGDRLVLSLAAGCQPISNLTPVTPGRAVIVLSGPEGGLSTAEEKRALAASFAAATLGERVLRAETAALAALVALTLSVT